MSVPAKEQRYHELITERESAQELGLGYKVEVEEILLDLKVLLRDYYTATFTKDENTLKLRFTNGQTFILNAKEVL